eukprot:478395-Pleurochrysis_carterae.AAC.2
MKADLIGQPDRAVDCPAIHAAHPCATLPCWQWSPTVAAYDCVLGAASSAENLPLRSAKPQKRDRCAELLSVSQTRVGYEQLPGCPPPPLPAVQPAGCATHAAHYHYPPPLNPTRHLARPPTHACPARCAVLQLAPALPRERPDGVPLHPG